MFCPKCGQEQVSEASNFCSRCGFQLTEVASLLVRSGTPAETREIKPPRDKARRFGLRLLLAALAFFIVSLISAANEGDEGVAIFGFLTFASFVVGICMLIYTWIRGRKRRRSESVSLGQQTSRVETTPQGALPPAYMPPPISVPRARFDTGDLARAPSVTEHTTRQFERDGERER